MRATGTVRDNRTSNCPLLTVAETSKRDKGFYDYRSDGSVIWKDNAAFTIGSNFERVNPVGKAKRWSKRERKYATIPQPALVNSYNQRMGGLDILDKLLGSYRPKLRKNGTGICL